MRKFGLIFILLLSFRSWANCPNCARIHSMEQHFLGLNYANQKQFDHGAGDVISAIGLLHRIAPRLTGPNPDVQEFQAVVKLVAAALPFDVETSMADVISAYIERSPKLRASYEKTLITLDPCRAQLLKTSVAEHACVDRLRAKGEYEKPGRSSNACDNIPDFDYGQCFNKSRHGAKRTGP